MDTKRIFVFLLMGIFMISMASAFEFDNYKEYDQETETITINNCALWVGGCLIGGDVLAEYTLTENTNQCMFDCNAEGTATLNGDQVLFQDVEFRNKVGNEKTINEFKWFIQVEDRNDGVRDTYETVCTPDPLSVNGTEICNQVVNGSEEWETVTYDWQRYFGEELPSGSYTWRIEGRKDLLQSVDWIVSSNGKQLTEWAWWNASWEYKRQINITETSATELYNHSVLLYVTYDSDMKTDFSDLRFLDSTESVELGYWVENKTDSNHAYVWVMVDTLTASDVTETYMYYSNSGASSNSDGTEAFMLYIPEDTTDYTYTNSGTRNDIWTDNIYINGAYMYETLQLWEYKSGTAWSNYAGLTIDTTGSALRDGNELLNFGSQGCDAGGTKWDGLTACRFGNPDGNQYADADGLVRTSPNVTGYHDIVFYSFLDTAGKSATIKSHEFTIRGYASSVPTASIGSEIANVNPPTVTLNTPANDFDQLSPNYDFNCTVSDDLAVKNVSLLIDGGIVETNTSGLDADYLFSYTVTGGSGAYNWSCDAYNTNNETDVYDVRNFTYSNNLAITLNAPVDVLNSSLSTISFNATPVDDTAVLNASLYINGVLNVTNSTPTNNTLLTNIVTIPDGDHNWTYQACDVYACATASARTFTVDTTAPTVDDAEGIADLNTVVMPINSTWNYTVHDPHISNCYYNTSDSASLVGVTCNASINTTWATGGNKTIQYFANDTFGWEANKLAYVYVYDIDYTQSEDLDPVAEGTEVTFTLNLSLVDTPSATATLRLNDTYYDVTGTASQNYTIFTQAITIPDGYGNTTGFPQLWLWNYTIAGVVTDQDTYNDNVTVYDLVVDDCSVYTDVILNFSLRDEELGTYVNESAGANVEIDLTLTSKTNSSFDLEYSNTYTNENNPQVCLPTSAINNSDFEIEFTLGLSSTDRVWEFYYLDNGTLDPTLVFDARTSQDIDLYDLLTADSTSFLFNYFDVDGLAVDEAIVHVYRQYIGDGVFKEVERAKADQNGDTIVHLVEEDVIYYFVITQYGQVLYTSSQYTALCQATPCTIQLEAGGSSAEFGTDWDQVPNGAYEIYTSRSTREVNLTYSLNSSSTMNLTVYKYESDGSYSVVNSTTDTGTSGSFISSVPQSAGNVSFFATVYQDDEFVNSEWVDMTQQSSDYFGSTLALFLGALIILTLGLMAVSQGAGTIVWVILGVFIAGGMGLLSTGLSTGLNVLVYLIVAGAILIWKLTGGRK